jgi:hypothetical protein
MRFIYSFVLFSLLGCTSEKSITISQDTGYLTDKWPEKILRIECVNEPGMDISIVNALAEFPVRNIQISGGSCCLQIEAVLAFHNKYLGEEIEQRVRSHSGVLSVTIK